MGMFDTIICHYHLPEKEHDSIRSWQTKDLECVLGTYYITAEGRLLSDESLYEEPLEIENWNGFPVVNTVGPGSRDTNYHGLLRFYSLFPENHDWSDDYDPNLKQEWIEYEAKFTDGTLVDIKQIPGVDWEKVWDSVKEEDGQHK